MFCFAKTSLLFYLIFINRDWTKDSNNLRRWLPSVVAAIVDFDQYKNPHTFERVAVANFFLSRGGWGDY